jgi:hypothetical protein
MNNFKKLLGLIVVQLILIQLINGCSSTSICEFPPAGGLSTKINTIYDEYGLALTSDTTKIFFTSTRGEEMEGGTEDLFVADKSEGEITEIQYLSEPASTGNNEGTPTFSKDGSYTILARSHAGGSGGTDLYSANVNGSNITNVQNLGSIVNSIYWDSQPSLSSDGKTLIFASDRPDGGKGKVDLWKSTKRSNNTWGKPENLGNVINTEGNEYSPYLYEDDKETILFFASDGRGDSKDSLDIYYASMRGENNWNTPVNIGESVNTQYNELFPYPLNGGKELIFASNNPNGCGGYDLFRKPIKVSPSCINLAGEVVDSSNDQPLSINANVKFINQKTGVEIIKNTSLPSSNYSIDEICQGIYTVEIQADGYFFKKYQTEITSVSKDFLHKLVPIPKATKPIRVFDLKEYNVPFFVTGYYRLNVPENLIELNSLLKTKLLKAGYIERPGPKYDDYSEYIQKLFKDTVFTFMKNLFLSNYLKDKKQYLEIEINGFTDPRYISGTYLEDDVLFNSTVVIKKGDNIENNVLSNLRAFYTKEYIDKQLMENENYSQIKSEGRIKYVIKGLGIDPEQKNVDREKDYDARRRIQIKVWVRYFDR